MQIAEFKKEVLIYKDPMYRLALRILGNEEDANDIVQDAFLKLWDRRKVLNEVKNLKSFSMTMIRNACIDQIRKNKPLNNKEQALANHPDERTPEADLDHKEELQIVNGIIDGLNHQQKEIIQMREIEGMEYDEIVEITGLSSNNLRVILSRTRKEIKAKLAAIMNFRIKA